MLGAIFIDERAVGLLDREVTRIATIGAAEDGAAEIADAAHHVPLEDERAAAFLVLLRKHQAVEAVADADDFPTSPPCTQRRRSG